MQPSIVISGGRKKRAQVRAKKAEGRQNNEKQERAAKWQNSAKSTRSLLVSVKCAGWKKKRCGRFLI